MLYEVITVPPRGPPAVLLLLAARLASSGLLPARPDGSVDGTTGTGRLEPVRNNFG